MPPIVPLENGQVSDLFRGVEFEVESFRFKDTTNENECIRCTKRFSNVCQFFEKKEKKRNIFLLITLNYSSHREEEKR